MDLVIIDIITSIGQSAIFAYAVSYCLERCKNKLKLICMLLSFVILSNAFAGTFGNNPETSVFLNHIIALIIIFLLYKKDFVKSFTAYSIVYIILGVFSVVFGNLIFEYFESILPVEYINYEKIFIIYIPQWLLLFLCYKYMDKILQITKTIIFEKFFISSIITSFILDFILTFYFLSFGEQSQLMKNIIYIVFFMFFAVILVYFAKVHQKSEQILELNQALEIKNSDLRKIKHDYGAQISYLYGLCLMNRFDDLKVALKDIINTNSNIPSAVEINDGNNSLLSLALKPALEMGIHVIIKGEGDITSVKMPEIELYRVISNIINNAIKAMDGKGIIIAKMYEQLDSLVIKIENNGPQIKEEDFAKIFQAGFTTKDNSEKSHGFGLSIVKELVESYDGKISLKSNEMSTEFKIVLPINN